MQKVLLLPMMTVIKECIFTSRLVIFNEPFCPVNLKLDENSVSVVWHEAVQKHDADNVTTSAFVKVMENFLGAEIFEFWADNCTNQNKI